LKIANESLKKQNAVLEETIEHHRSADPKPVKASDLGRLRIKLEHKDEQIAQLERQVAELQAEINQLKA
jgi:predicted RNase H-like nuclease (RuvC/YqgF family)